MSKLIDVFGLTTTCVHQYFYRVYFFWVLVNKLCSTSKFTYLIIKYTYTKFPSHFEIYSPVEKNQNEAEVIKLICFDMMPII